MLLLYLHVMPLLTGVGGIILCTALLLRAPIGYAALVAPVLFPLYSSALLLPTIILTASAEAATRSKTEALFGKLALFEVGTAGALSVTFLALAIGHVVDPSSYVPQTFQLLVSNVLCDGLTLLLTFTIIEKALRSPGLYGLPAAVLKILSASGLLACCSLYFGLLFTRQALDLTELLHVFVGRSPNGLTFELSPYFWVMHTTFIPTLLYLSFIMLCWTAKTFLIPVRWFFGKGKELGSPLNLTAALCALIAAMFGVGAYAAGTWQEYVERHQSSPQSPSAVNMIYFEGMRSSPLTASKTLLKPSAFAKAQV